ncbi:MAG TPA: hypothetical protein VI112_16570 [Bacteroidia bacterium]|jgi:hypothetical protein
MQDIFFTILVIWILFRVLNSNSWGSRNVYYTQNNYQGKANNKKEGETVITNVSNRKSTISPGEGEYVDFEEIK